MKNKFILIMINFIFFNFAADKKQLNEENDAAYQNYLDKCTKRSGYVSEYLLTELVNIVQGYHCISYKQWQENKRKLFRLLWSEKGKIDELKELLDSEEVDINALDSSGYNALVFAIAFIKDVEVEVIELLINAGINVNFKSPAGDTALHKASYIGNKKIAELLINANADVNAKSNNVGDTPLHRAIRSKNIEIAELLINANADVNAKNDCGQTPLYLATYLEDSKEIVDFLIKAGAKS